MGRRIGAVPDSIKNLAEQLQQFRSTHAIRTRLPEALWQKAVEAERQHGSGGLDAVELPQFPGFLLTSCQLLSGRF